MTMWIKSHRGTRAGCRLFRRHYSAKNLRPKQRQLAPPGETLVLLGYFCEAVFVWVKQRYRMDEQTGINCAVFRNESLNRSSDMIREAEEWAWEKWPGERLFTMVDAARVRSSQPGKCFIKAGWRQCGVSKSGKLIFEKLP